MLMIPRFIGFDEDLTKYRGRLGPDRQDVQTMTILGRLVEYQSWGLPWRADSKHNTMIMEHFGFNDHRALVQ